MKTFRRVAALSCGLLYALQTSANQPLTQTKPADLPQQVTLAGQSFVLEEQQKRCAMRKPDGSLLNLDIPWPCAFSDDRKGLPRVEKFNDNAEIVIVYHLESQPESSASCKSQYQAIRLIKGRLESSMAVPSALCMRGMIDQKHFVGHFDW